MNEGILMKKTDFKKSEISALDLLSKFSYRKPAVDPFEISRGLGINVNFVRMKEDADRENVSGFFDASKNAIIVNSEQGIARQTFTVAHELGHKILHSEWLDDANEILYRSAYVSQDWREQEANFFAANLLLPKFMMDDYKEKYGLNEKDLDLWAGVFCVSKEFMANRWRFLYGK